MFTNWLIDDLIVYLSKKSGLFNSLTEVKIVTITLFVYVSLFDFKRNALFKIMKERREKYVKT